MKIVRLLSRVLLGMVFLFSGFVKAVDPLGSAYKFSDYFSAFRLEFLSVTALPLSIGLSAFELLLGFSLILGYRRKITFRVVFWFMLFFTLLTLILAIFNPVSDCGCFGDALILTNWQTFLKNLVLMLFVLPLYAGRNEPIEGGREWIEWGVITLLYAGSLFFSLWNYRHLPLLDFRPYDVGTVIEKEMEIPEGAPVDEYETTLTYRDRSTGKNREFTLEDYPRDTMRWEFVNSESRLVKKGDEPAIHDFALMDPSGENVADRILADPGYTLLMISENLTRASQKSLLQAREWSQLELLAENFRFYAVTASTREQVSEISSSLGLGYDIYMADGIMLKTMIRSNPGFMLIGNGMIIGKWAFRDFPSLGALDPGALELIGNAAAPLGEEAELLQEAGIYEDFSFDVLDFETFLPDLVFTREARKSERRVVLLFISGILLLLLLSNRFSAVRI